MTATLLQLNSLVSHSNLRVRHIKYVKLKEERGEKERVRVRGTPEQEKAKCKDILITAVTGAV